eukprot:gene8415-biopygen13670
MGHGLSRVPGDKFREQALDKKRKSWRNPPQSFGSHWQKTLTRLGLDKSAAREKWTGQVGRTRQGQINDSGQRTWTRTGQVLSAGKAERELDKAGKKVTQGKKNDKDWTTWNWANFGHAIRTPPCPCPFQVALARFKWHLSVLSGPSPFQVALLRFKWPFPAVYGYPPPHAGRSPPSVHPLGVGLHRTKVVVRMGCVADRSRA